MRLFCKHKFVEKGNSIYCKKCGKTKHLTCDHKWTIHSSQNISAFGNEQVQQILVCEKCGKFQKVNLTTGQGV